MKESGIIESTDTKKRPLRPVDSPISEEIKELIYGSVKEKEGIEPFARLRGA